MAATPAASDRQDRKPWVGHLLSFVGCALCISASPAAARPRPATAPIRGPEAAQPWIEADGSPPPFASSRAPHVDPPWKVTPPTSRQATRSGMVGGIDTPAAAVSTTTPVDPPWTSQGSSRIPAPGRDGRMDTSPGSVTQTGADSQAHAHASSRGSTSGRNGGGASTSHVSNGARNASGHAGVMRPKASDFSTSSRPLRIRRPSSLPGIATSSLDVPPNPAIHGARGERIEPLFPRANRGAHFRQGLESAMRRHPAGKLSSQRRYVVGRGDSLWSIASESAPDGSIAGAVDDIYKLNRRVIGPDPDLILPGQVLRLPEDTAEKHEQR